MFICFLFRSRRVSGTILNKKSMDNPAETPKEFIPVHSELKVYDIQEFYSVPKSFLGFLEQDMQAYGNLIHRIRAIGITCPEHYSIIMRMDQRIDAVWSQYLIYMRTGTAQNRINQLRDCNRKLWYAASIICTLLTTRKTIPERVSTRRMEYILEEMEDLANSIKGESTRPYDEWLATVTIRLHRIV